MSDDERRINERHANAEDEFQNHRNLKIEN